MFVFFLGLTISTNLHEKFLYLKTQSCIYKFLLNETQIFLAMMVSFKPSQTIFLKKKSKQWGYEEKFSTLRRQKKSLQLKKSILFVLLFAFKKINQPSIAPFKLLGKRRWLYMWPNLMEKVFNEKNRPIIMPKACENRSALSELVQKLTEKSGSCPLL